MRASNLVSSVVIVAAVFAGYLRGDEQGGLSSANPTQIAELIEQLGDSSFAVREHAQRRLELVGASAFDALMDAQSHSDLEIALRAKYLVATIDISWSRDDDPLPVRQLLADYRSQDDAARYLSMRLIAALPKDEGLAALVRLIRYEKSPLVSKLGALLIISPEYPRERRPAGSVIEASLGPSKRKTADWLRTYLNENENSEDLAARWQPIVDEEAGLLRSKSQDTSQAVVLGLMHHQISHAAKAKKDESLKSFVRTLLELETKDTPRIVQSLDRFVRESAWDALSVAEEQLTSELDSNADIIYAIANANREQGQAEQADQLAKKALGLAPTDPREHLRVAYGLERRGLAAWSEQEYRHVIGMQGIDAVFPIIARFQLSELLHDRERELDAAEVLKPVVDSIGADATAREKIQALDRLPEAVQSRMHYFYAMHYKNSGDMPKQLEHLNKAIKFDRTDADVLIGLYLLPDRSEAERAATLTRIREAASIFREGTMTDPEDSTSYNQYAWLIGNTEGDFDEAIRFSHKSLELRPGTAGYIDTLAHSYFGKGDVENAARYQGQAAVLDPHSQQIRRALHRFQTATSK